MARTLCQVAHFAQINNGCPVYIAGDIFDHWQQPPELINFAIDHFKHFGVSIYAIPGQHDLPNHNLSEMRRSAFHTLVKAGAINYLPDLEDFHYRRGKNRLIVDPFPWGAKLKPNPRKRDYRQEVMDGCRDYHIALVHRYVFSNKKTAYPGAPKENRTSKTKPIFEGYDVAVFGDNHSPFYEIAEDEGEPWIVNCGALIRRKMDERSYKPTIWFLCRGTCGMIVPVELDTSEDKFIDADKALEVLEKGLEMGDFLADLASLGDTAVSFMETVERFLVDNGVGNRIKRLVLAALRKDK